MEKAKIQKRVAINHRLDSMNKKSFVKDTPMATPYKFSSTSIDNKEILSSYDLPNEIASYIPTDFLNNFILQVINKRDFLTNKCYTYFLKAGI
jgi:hypothetical protein